MAKRLAYCFELGSALGFPDVYGFEVGVVEDGMTDGIELDWVLSMSDGFALGFDVTDLLSFALPIELGLMLFVELGLAL